ncbi:MAG: serine/threonine-protein kinase [Sandaracinaceae bacterium]
MLDPRLGRTLAGRYRLDRTLGKGGMGVVYAGEDTELGRPVAVKVLLPELIESAELLARFFQEARTAAALSHPHVIDVYDLGEDDGLAYIVMELLEGESLETRLRREGRLRADALLPILLPVIEALGVAHERGIIHRDLKPENVFIARTPNGEETPKLLDFGIAKLLEGGVVQTQAGAMLGTPGYMSPEQMRGVGDLTAASDVWGVGVILFRALAGRLPFETDGHNPMNLLMTMMMNDAPRLCDVAPDVPEALGAAVDLALKRSPETRHRDMHELREALVEAVADRAAPISSEPPPLPPGVI